MSELHKFKIHAALNSSDMYVEMDGERLQGVCGVSFDLKGGQVTTVNLSLMGEVFVDGEFRPNEIAQIKREVIHPGYLRHRVRRAFRNLFIGADDQHINALTENVLCGLEVQGDAA